MSSRAAPSDSDPITDLQNQFFDAISAGKLDKVTHLLQGVVDVDRKNERGWSGLMLAARNGHSSVIAALLDKGCDTNAVNSTGQTALDIATFWNHKEAAKTLEGHVQEETTDQNCRNFFSLNLLNRAAEKRKDEDWIAKNMKLPSTKYLLFTNLNPYIKEIPKTVVIKRKWKYSLARFSYSDIEFHLSTKPVVVLLGQDKIKSVDEISVRGGRNEGTEEVSTYFAIDVTGVEEEKFLSKSEGVTVLATPWPGAMQLTPSEAGIFSEARSLLAWHDRYRFCPTCGSTTHSAEAGYKRSCDNVECRSHKGAHNTCYPRVDPSMIILVVSPDNGKCLLGRGRHFPGKMFSCLAGYMEPGESLEDTCRREVAEESGVTVGRVDYHSSQPWPFPAVLMLGCIAHATNTHIQVDQDELEDARWFTRPDVVQMMTNQHPDGLFVPPEQAVAHQLIKSWLRMSANL